MKKQNDTVSEKIKCDLSISVLELTSSTKLKSIIEISTHHIIFKILSIPSKKEDLNINNIHKILSPLYKECSLSSKQNSHTTISYYINYSLIKSLKISNHSEELKFHIINPISNMKFIISISNLELIGIIFNKKLLGDSVNSLANKISHLISKETKYLIDEYLNIFSLFKDCLDPSKTENDYIEEILLKAYLIGKIYFEKYSKELKKNDKIKENAKRDNKISLYDRFFKDQKLNDIDNKINYEIFHKSEISFESLINELKIRTSIYIEETIGLFFKVLSFNNNSNNNEYMIQKNKYYKLQTEEMSFNLKNINEKEHLYNTKRINDSNYYENDNNKNNKNNKDNKDNEKNMNKSAVYVNKDKLKFTNINCNEYLLKQNQVNNKRSKSIEEVDMVNTESTKTNSDKNNLFNKDNQALNPDESLNCPRLNYHTPDKSHKNNKMSINSNKKNNKNLASSYNSNNNIVPNSANINNNMNRSSNNIYNNNNYNNYNSPLSYNNNFNLNNLNLNSLNFRLNYKKYKPNTPISKSKSINNIFRSKRSKYSNNINNNNKLSSNNNDNNFDEQSIETPKFSQYEYEKSKKSTYKSNRKNNIDNNNIYEKNKINENDIIYTNNNYDKNINNTLNINNEMNYSNNYINENLETQKSNISSNEIILFDINENKKNHSLLQPNSIENIIFNTSEIIHRKFFSILFDGLVGKIFNNNNNNGGSNGKEKDNSNFINLDYFYNYFFYLKALKKILFVEKNKAYFSNLMFNNKLSLNNINDINFISSSIINNITKHDDE